MLIDRPLFRAKLRGWRDNKDNDIWKYGNYVFAAIGTDNIPKHLIVETPRDYFEIDPDTLGQYTGVQDRQGNQVFHRDIVLIDEEVKRMFHIQDGQVRYHRGLWFIGDHPDLLSSLFSVTDIYYILRGIVIGNVYETSESCLDEHDEVK